MKTVSLEGDGGTGESLTREISFGLGLPLRTPQTRRRSVVSTIGRASGSGSFVSGRGRVSIRANADRWR